jgi:hypothetical protein
VSRKKYGLKKSDVVVLSTITKTGTHFLRMLILFVLKRHFTPDDTVSIAPMEIDEVFPNSYHIHYLYPSNLKKTPTASDLGFSFFDLPRSHLPYQPAWKNQIVIHTYRNPIIFATIYYLYKIHGDPLIKFKDKKNVFEVFKEQLPEFKKQYLSHQNKSNVFRLNFDNYDVHDLIRLLKILGIEAQTNQVKDGEKFIRENYPSLTIGAGEAWFRNGKVRDYLIRAKYEETFLLTGRHNLEIVWSKNDLEQAKIMIIEDLDLKEFHEDLPSIS